MSTDIQSAMPEVVREAVKGLSMGIVLTAISLENVLECRMRGVDLELAYVDSPATADVSRVDEGYQITALYQETTNIFRDVRDLDIQKNGGGAFAFTATYHYYDEWIGNYGPRADTGDIHFRFHVTNQGKATFVRRPS